MIAVYTAAQDLCGLALAATSGYPQAMESHEWREHTAEGPRYYRATHHGERWTILSTLKTDPDWEKLDPAAIPEDVWRALRDVVWRKYQRRRCPWERVVELDKLLGDEPAPEGR